MYKKVYSILSDDVEYGFDENDHTKLDNFGRLLLHGKGHDRWFDKSFNLCFSNNGYVSKFHNFPLRLLYDNDYGGRKYIDIIHISI